MSARLLDGRALARTLHAELKQEAAALRRRGITPVLAIVDASGDPAARQYVERKRELAHALGIETRLHPFDPQMTQDGLLDLVRSLDGDPVVHGIIVEQPLAAQFRAEPVLAAVSPAKDVDGTNPASQGLLALGTPRFVPATALAAITLLLRYEIPLAGREAVVIGRSPVVGRPAAQLLLLQNATVTICHSRTTDLAAHLRAADVVIAAAGRANLVRGSMLKPGAAVVDVGTNFVDGRTVGDVAFAEAMEVAGAVSPVPGGVGPLTTALLLRNTLHSAADLAGVTVGGA